MKKTFLALSLSVATLVSCSKEDKTTPDVVKTTETYVDASSRTTWHYYSLADSKFVGTGEQTEQDNSLWSARADWDLAFNRYLIRTNSGASTSVEASGGVHTFAPSVTFTSVMALPSDLQLVPDRSFTNKGMDGKDIITIMSEASVIKFKTNSDGSMIMPPVYLPTPVYIFRTANGKSHYKVQFTQYQNDAKITGHIKFYSAQIK